MELNELRATVKSIKFQNDDNGYCVLACDYAGEDLIVVGFAPFVYAGMGITATGDFINHQSYGRQFKAESIEAVMPCDEKSIEDFLGGGAIKGIGKVTAARIVELFGAQTIEVIEKSHEKLTQVKGINSAKASEINKSLLKIQGIGKTIAQLSVYTLPPHVAIKLYKNYGSLALSVISKNPYIICDSDYDMEFEFADRLAKQFDVKEESPVRLKAGIKYVLTYNLKNGHTFAPRNALIRACINLLGAAQESIEAAADELSQEGELSRADISGHDAFYLKGLYDAECRCAEKLRQLDLYKPKVTFNVDKEIDNIEKKLSIEYAQLQRKAIKYCLENGVFILTGGPGTGKTTALNGIISVFQSLGLDIALAAPTGRAAKRMTEVTGMQAKTVHRLLEMEYSSGSTPKFARDEKNPLQADAVIIDESSMLDVILLDALLRAVRQGTRIVFVGDKDQLPPVGAGNVFKDMLQSDRFCTVYLTEIWRQAKDSLIVVNAHMILEGDEPELNEKSSDFFFLQRTDREQTAQTVAGLVAKRLPKNLGFDPWNDIQVITATRKGDIGTVNLNGLLQSALNPYSPEKREFRRGDFVFRCGDKVMQTKNNYEMLYVKQDTGEVGAGVFNGDIGIIESIDKMAETATIRFDDRICEYLFEQFDQLELAYAITVHKAQGSEFRAVVMPVWFGSDKLQSRNLLYTAITRAKETFILTGSRDAIIKMAANNRENRRYSGLASMLQS